jgi:large subunit ribosomal protein L31e
MVEKIITINIRKELLNKPYWNRSGRAPALLRKYLERHVEAKKILIDGKLNEKIWQRGIKKPLTKMRVRVSISDDGTAKATLLQE